MLTQQIDFISFEAQSTIGLVLFLEDSRMENKEKEEKVDKMVNFYLECFLLVMQNTKRELSDSKYEYNSINSKQEQKGKKKSQFLQRSRVRKYSASNIPMLHRSLNHSLFRIFFLVSFSMYTIVKDTGKTGLNLLAKHLNHAAPNISQNARR